MNDLKLTYLNQAYVDSIYNDWLDSNNDNIDLFLKILMLSNQIKDIYSYFDN
jgi:hypothetical protein